MVSDFFDKTRAGQQLAYEEIVARIARALHSPDNFNEIEIHAHLKPGLEVPLMGVATMPDVIRQIYARRQDEDKKFRLEIEENLKRIGELKQDGWEKDAEKSREVSLRLHRIQRIRPKLLTDARRMRYEHAENLLSSMVRHLYQITMAIDGKRAEQGVENIKAIVLHEQDKLEALMGNKKPSLKERLHLGK